MTSSPRPTTIVYAFLDFADGGAQRLTLGHCLRMNHARFRPEILCVRGPRTAVDASHPTLIAAARAASLTVHILGRLHRPYDLAAVPIIAARLRSISPGIVHVPLYSRTAPYVLLAARLARVPLIVAHEWSRARPPSAARRVADRLLRPGTRFVAVSEHHARALVAEGIPPDDVRVVIDGVDTDRFQPRDRDAARAELDLPADRPIALVPARLHPAKGHADLMAALPTVLRRAPDLLILCAGDGPLRDRLPAEARSAGLPSSTIRFLGQRHDMPALFAAADLVVLPSRVEGLPSAMLEAFASARPVIATDVGGVSEALVDGEAGRLVPAGDPVALAAAIIDLVVGSSDRSDSVFDVISNSRSGADARVATDARAAMGARGRALALERFRAEDSTRRLEAVYEAWL